MIGSTQLDLFAVRPPSPATIFDLVPLGTIVDTIYVSQSPYIVTKIERDRRGFIFYLTRETLFLEKPTLKTLFPASPWFLNRRVAHGGRLRHAEHDDFRDETFIRGFNADAAALLVAA